MHHSVKDTRMQQYDKPQQRKQHSPSSFLSLSSCPFSISASLSFTNAIMPPNGGERISSINSCSTQTHTGLLTLHTVSRCSGSQIVPVFWPAAAAGSPPPLYCRPLLSPAHTHTHTCHVAGWTRTQCCG